MWIVLGPLGQSTTAVSHLGTDATRVLPAPYGTGATVAGLLYGVPVWGFAMVWLVLAAAITVRTARTAGGRLPFALTWWSFTFPVGTCVTGTIALATRSHDLVLQDWSVVLYVLLVLAWLTVVVRTALFVSLDRGAPEAPSSLLARSSLVSPDGTAPRRSLD
jgi:tellurite resistance protein TehA-like permease